MQKRYPVIDVAGHEDRQIGYLHSMRINWRQPVLIQFDTQCFQPKVVDIWPTAQADKNTVDNSLFTSGTYLYSAFGCVQISLLPQMNGKFLFQKFYRNGIDAGVFQSCDGSLLVKQPPSTPSRESAWAISAPTGPKPTTAMQEGSVCCSNNVSVVSNCLPNTPWLRYDRP